MDHLSWVTSSEAEKNGFPFFEDSKKPESAYFKPSGKLRIKKDEKKGILFGDTSRYSIQTFISLGERVGKRVSMADVLKTESGVKMAKDFCLKVKKEGHNILNTNLPFAV